MTTADRPFMNLTLCNYLVALAKGNLSAFTRYNENMRVRVDNYNTCVVILLSSQPTHHIEDFSTNRKIFPVQIKSPLLNKLSHFYCSNNVGENWQNV